MTTAISQPLQRDLEPVLGTTAEPPGPLLRCRVAGRDVSLDEAVSAAAECIARSRAPAIVGAGGLSIEAVRHAVALAEAVRGRMLPLAVTAGTGGTGIPPVVQTATLGHVRSCPLQIHVGSVPPLVARWQPADAATVQLPPDLETVRRLRAAMASAEPDDGLARSLLAARRAAVLVAGGTDPRVPPQWHRLAAQHQARVRLAVVELPPGLGDDRPGPQGANLRGALEVICWQTGRWGNIDFADGAPRPCPGWRTLLDRGAIDLLIDVGADAIAADVPRIRIGPGDGDAHVQFITPGLAAGVAARVMRFDGAVLWLCDDPPSSPADPAAEVLEAMLDRVQDAASSPPGAPSRSGIRHP